MTARSEAVVATDRPERYGKQLVAHLSRRNGGDGPRPTSRVGSSSAPDRAELRCGPDGLRLSVEAEPAELPVLEDVVGRHLVRFGSRDELQVRWARSTGELGSANRSTRRS